MDKFVMDAIRQVEQMMQANNETAERLKESFGSLSQAEMERRDDMNAECLIVRDKLHEAYKEILARRNAKQV